MRYLNTHNIVSAYQNNAKTTKNKFWGLLALLSGVGQKVQPGVNYYFNQQFVGSVLDRLFLLDGQKKSLSIGKLTSNVIFSTHWIEVVKTDMVVGKPNIYDVATWYFRNEEFEEGITAKGLVTRFIDELYLSEDFVNTIFSLTEERQIIFERYQASDQDILSKLNLQTSTGSITAESSTIAAFPRELSRAPFFQTLYSSQSILAGLIITNFDFAEYYLVSQSQAQVLPKSYNGDKGQLLQLYKYFITNCTLKAKSITNYTDFKRINECIAQLGLDGYKELLDFDNPVALENAIEKLKEQPLYIDYNKRGNNQYSATIGTYLQFLYALQLSGVDKVSSSPSFSSLDQPLQQIFYGAPGTGKSHTIKKTTDGVDSKFVVRTTFHPDSDYSTFVGAYKPKMETLPRYNPQTGEQMGVEKRIVYAYTPQAFLKAYITAWQNPEQPVYLIIEEINRGNCAQIFGDLFQLLDRSNDGLSCYPIKADQDMQMHLMEVFAGYDALPENIRSGEELVLPPNLYIWATMNTSDQSLFPIDSAFKRRWEWKYIPITQGKDKETGKLMQWSIEAEGVNYDWWSFLEVMNKRVGDITSSEDKKLGFFFCKADGQGVISADKFVSKVMFYLWNDVFKDYPDNPIAMYLKEEGGEFTYGDFYTTNAGGDVVVREELVTRLFGAEALGVKKVSAITIEESYDERADIPTQGQERKDTLSSVSINGKQFTEQEYTQFDLYMNVLREIGIDKTGAAIESMKFTRKGSKMATRNPLPQLAEGYTYVKEGEYYYIKGANPYTLIRILEELKTVLNLDMVIAYR